MATESRDINKILIWMNLISTYSLSISNNRPLNHRIRQLDVVSAASLLFIFYLIAHNEINSCALPWPTTPNNNSILIELGESKTILFDGFQLADL